MSVLIRMSVGINEGTKRVKGYQTETARTYQYQSHSDKK